MRSSTQSETLQSQGGHVVVSPPGEAHGFTNTGPGELRLTAIHGADRFNTEWLAGPDPTWTSKRRVRRGPWPVLGFGRLSRDWSG